MSTLITREMAAEIQSSDRAEILPTEFPPGKFYIQLYIQQRWRVLCKNNDPIFFTSAKDAFQALRKKDPYLDIHTNRREAL